MKLKTVKIPDSTADMNMSHLRFFMELAKLEGRSLDELTPVEIADMLCVFFGRDADGFDQYTPQSNKNLFLEVCASCGRHKSKPIKRTYKIDGKVYNFIPDYSTVNTAYHRDISKTDFEKNPLDLLAFCYIEEGMTYNQLDKSKQIINPKRARGEAIGSQISLAEYLDLQSFFLSSYPVLIHIFENQQSMVRSQSLSLGSGSNQ